MGNSPATNKRPECEQPKKLANNVHTASSHPPADHLDTADLLRTLGLVDYYPSKITLCDVMAVQNRSYDKESDLPWLILQKLIMLDYKGRERELSLVFSSNGDNSSEDSLPGKSMLDDFLQCMNNKEDCNTPNPLDVFVAILACCDLVLKQTLVRKMFMCRLAVPLIYPGINGNSFVFSLWALRSIIVEWLNKDQVPIEMPVVDQPVNIVAFLKLGTSTFSKSALLNNIISDQPHHTFWNRECPLGETKIQLADGLVEAQWYLPAGKPEEIFNKVTMFLNLRGNASRHNKQVTLLQKIANVMICCIDISDLKNAAVKETMKSIHSQCAQVIILLTMSKPPMRNLRKCIEMYFKHVDCSHNENTKLISTFNGDHARTTEDIKTDIRRFLQVHLKNQKEMPITNVSSEAKNAGIIIDEDNEFCIRGKELAEQVIETMKGKDTATCKREMLPLQGEDWEKWSKLLKVQQCGRDKDMDSTTMHEMEKINQEMKKLRVHQAKNSTDLSPLMKTFIENIMQVTDTPAAFPYLHWLNIYLDERSRNTLPGLQKLHHEKWKEYNALKNDGQNVCSKDDEIGKLKKELAATEKLLSESSLGVEHLFREAAQMYEAVQENTQDTRSLEILPEIAAKLLLIGQPLELLDGDVVNVPLTWIKAVFSSLAGLVGDKKLFVISVLGIQSSGKSTLLNTMFGLQFAVSAGRCTRGVYMQLIKVDRKRSDLPYDYVLVVDTEGLRAAELGQLKYDNDNQLTTFVIGLGDVTLLNIKGENVTEISDVLQIAVHAFLNMKLSENNLRKHRTCYFIHQNVPAINAKVKMQQGTRALQEKLDLMTKEACDLEDVMDIHCFNQVIRFDSETNVWHFSDLWLGDPPMAPVNPGYTERVQEVRAQLFDTFKDKGFSFLTISDVSTHIKDLWKAVLTQDFVFSFRNTLAAKAYSSLEKTYHEKSWEVEHTITKWVMCTANVHLERCKTEAELHNQYLELQTDLEKLGGDLVGKVCSEFEKYIESHDLKDIVMEWKNQKLSHLQSDTDSFLDRARQMLQQDMRNRKVALLQLDKFSDIDAEVMKRARALADQMKGKQTVEAELEKIFDEFWMRSVADFGPPKATVEDSIARTTERLLYKRLPRENPLLKVVLEKKSLSDCPPNNSLEDSFTFEQITNSDISLLTSNRSQKGKARDSKLESRQKALEAIHIILNDVQIYLTEISSQQSDFQDIYATDVINIVLEGIEMQNKKHKDQNSFAMLPQLKVKAIVHVCRHAVKVFRAIHLEHEERHSVAKKLEIKRHGTWNLFRNKVNQCTNERIASDLFLSELEVLVTQAVRKEMMMKVVNEILQHFGFQKYSLLTKLLGDLAEEDSFVKYMFFVTRPKAFGQHWITSFTNKVIFNKKGMAGSKYAMFAKVNIDRLVHSIEECIKSTTAYIRREPKPNIQTWVKKFCSVLQELPVTEEHLQQMMEQDVEDFENFEALMIQSMQTMTERVLEPFNAETAYSIRWEGTTPYKQILDRLWGCEARCPFCSEICQRTDPNHLSLQDSHQCIQHRPSGVNGSWWAKEDGEHADKLTLATCNFEVQSNNSFKRNGKKYLFREYKKYEPDWDIAPSPSMESCQYWMWFMATYKHQLADKYNRKVPDIPEAWHDITKREALDSLRVYVN